MSRDAWKRFSESQRSSYDVVEVGYKMNLTDIQSAIGLVQLQRIDEMYKRRQELWNLYTRELSSLPLELPLLPPKDSGDQHALHLYTVGLPNHVNRDQFVWECKQLHGVTMGVHYNSVNSFSIYKKMKIFEEPPYLCPIAYDWGSRTVSLSLSASVTDQDAYRVLSAVKNTLKSQDTL